MLYGLMDRLQDCPRYVSISCYIWKIMPFARRAWARALWAIRQLNFDFKKAGDLRKLQISELEEIKNDAYDNARISKHRMKLFHDRFINRKNFVPDKMFCCTTPNSTFSLINWRPGSQGRILYTSFSLMVLLRFQIPRMVAFSKSITKD